MLPTVGGGARGGTWTDGLRRAVRPRRRALCIRFSAAEGQRASQVNGEPKYCNGASAVLYASWVRMT